MYRKSLRAKKLEAKRKRCARMRAAKERLRLERTQDAECVGTVVFDGPMFDGKHEIRCLAADWFSDRHVMIEIDGKASSARTERGVLGLLARRLTKGN